MVVQVLAVLAILACVFVAARIASRRIEVWAQAMVCSFGLPPLQEEKQVGYADSAAKQPIVKTKSKFRHGFRRLAKLATSYLLS
jgi:hypothetical protein